MSERSAPHHFEHAQAVLRGEPCPTSVDGVRKTLRFVFWPGGSNVWIDRQSLKLRWVDGTQRHAFTYFLELAPGVVREVMYRLGVSEIVRPVVGHLATSRAQIHPLGEREDYVGWVIPQADEIQIIVRPLADPTPPQTGAIPETGPWKLPEPLPAWAPAVPVYVQFTEGLDCPRCGQTSESYRRLNDGCLVCETCSGSFRP